MKALSTSKLLRHVSVAFQNVWQSFENEFHAVIEMARSFFKLCHTFFFCHGCSTVLVILCVYKILVFDDAWVNKIFCNHEFTKHFSHCSGCYVRIVQHFSCFVHKSPFKTYDTTLENFCLSSSRQLFFSFDIQFIKLLTIRSIENLVFRFHLDFWKRGIKTFWISIVLEYIFTVYHFSDVAIGSYYRWNFCLTHFWDIVR